MGVTMATHNGAYGRRPLIEILSEWHVHELVLILGAWHTRALGHAAPSRTQGALLSQRAFELQDDNSEPGFRPAPGRNPQSSDVERENGVGCLARIGCIHPAALLDISCRFFRFSVR